MSIPRILQYPGSKWSIAEWIISHMPIHSSYLEPFFGSGAVLFNKVPAALETINDIDGNVVNLFRTVRDRQEELANKIKWTPYAREEYNTSYDKSEDELERARRFLVICWQSIKVKTSSKSGWKCRGTEDEVYHVKQWNNLTDSIIAVGQRLREVQIENCTAVSLIKRFQRREGLIYADPPYLMSTRSGGAAYKNEMTIEDHEELLETLCLHQGPALLSGYRNSMYDSILKDWLKVETEGKHVQGKPRIEVLWINPVAAGQQNQLTLF